MFFRGEGSTDLGVEVDFAGRMIREEPEQVYASVTAAGGLATVRGMRAVLVTSYAEVARLLKDDRLGFEEVEAGRVPPKLRGYVEMRQRLMLFQNAPQHLVTRAAGMAELRGCPQERLGEILEKTASEVIAEFSGGNLISKAVQPYVARVILRVLGLPEERVGEVVRLANELADALDPCALQNSKEEAGERYLEMKKNVSALAGGPANLETLVMLVAAGLQTTGHSLGLAVARTLEKPGCYDVTREFIEECYRFDSPAQVTRRVVREEMEVGGKTLRPGMVVWLGLAGANRDLEVFEKADSFVEKRWPNRHLAFGAGAHRCIGMALAREELRVFLEKIPECWVLGEKRAFTGNLVFRGLRELEVKVSGN